jgi:hypothetical protein
VCVPHYNSALRLRFIAEPRAFMRRRLSSRSRQALDAQRRCTQFARVADEGGTLPALSILVILAGR